ncbi:MAG: bis(5'-nucleosyl)-tetraphosphatase (symmetrical) YqeK [Brevinematia bacterium]
MEEIINFAKKKLSKKRFKHSLGVAKIALKLGKIYKVSEERLFIASLLHDIAKEMNYNEQIEHLKKYKVKLEEEELECKGVLHAYVSAIIARENFNIDDEIFNAIYYHSTGHKDFDIFGKIIFASDYLDPTRKLHKQKKLLKITKKNIDEGLILIIKEKINYLIDEKVVLHHNTIGFYNSILRKIKID